VAKLNKSTPFGWVIWECNCFTGSQEIPHILWNLNVHDHVLKTLPLAPVLSLNNTVYYYHPVSWRSMLILFCHPWLGLPGGVCSSGFPTKTLHARVVYQVLAMCPTHLILCDFKHAEIFVMWLPTLGLTCQADHWGKFVYHNLLNSMWAD
jgi:hypothetical protein